MSKTDKYTSDSDESLNEVHRSPKKGCGSTHKNTFTEYANNIPLRKLSKQ